LIERARQGHLEEFAAIDNHPSPPEPQAEATFLSAKLDQEQRQRGNQRVIFDFYCELVRLRKECAPLARLSREAMQVIASEEEQVLAIIRRAADDQVFCLFNYSDQNRVIPPSLASGTLRVLLDSTGNYRPGSDLTVYSTRPTTFPTLAPFGVFVYRKE